jgi:serine/threonine-protein kinase RsbW
VTQPDGEITVTAPAEPESVAIMRMVAAAVAGRTDASIDTVDDLRIAVAEACNRLLAGAPSASRLHMDIEVDTDILEARITADLSDGRVATEDLAGSELSWNIIRGLTDSAESSTVDGRPTITLAVHIFQTGR